MPRRVDSKKKNKRDWRWWASLVLNGAVVLSMTLGTVFLFTGAPRPSSSALPTLEVPTAGPATVVPTLPPATAVPTVAPTPAPPSPTPKASASAHTSDKNGNQVSFEKPGFFFRPS